MKVHEKEKESNEKLAIEISSDLKTVSIKNQFDSLSNTNFSFDKMVETLKEYYNKNVVKTPKLVLPKLPKLNKIA